MIHALRSKETPINLGRKTVWWIIKIFLLCPIWVLRISPNKKTWEEFKYGLINHKCDFDYEKLVPDEKYKYHPCKHFGCGIIKPHM
jgi:hypothetical protein